MLDACSSIVNVIANASMEVMRYVAPFKERGGYCIDAYYSFIHLYAEKICSTISTVLHEVMTYRHTIPSQSLLQFVIYIQWDLRIKDNLGPGILSLVRRLVSLRGKPIFSLKMPLFMLLQV